MVVVFTEGNQSEAVWRRCASERAQTSIGRSVVVAFVVLFYDHIIEETTALNFFQLLYRRNRLVHLFLSLHPLALVQKLKVLGGFTLIDRVQSKPPEVHLEKIRDRLCLHSDIKLRDLVKRIFLLLSLLLFELLVVNACEPEADCCTQAWQ